MSVWKDDDVDRYSPSVRKRRLGKGLRGLREGRGQTAEAVAKDLDMSTSQLTKIETADRNISKTALLGLLGYYEASEQDRTQLLELHASSRARGWWQDFGVQPGAYIDWEAEAIKIQSFEPLLIPGLLQTQDYAEAVIAATWPNTSASERLQRAKVRAARAALLDDPDGPELWFVVHEAALRTVVGGAETMTAQLQRVLDLAESVARLTIQVLPFAAGEHPGMDGAFTVLTFEDLSPLGFVEHSMSAGWYERPGEINALTLAFGRLTESSLSAKESSRLIRRLMKELS